MMKTTNDFPNGRHRLGACVLAAAAAGLTLGSCGGRQQQRPLGADEMKGRWQIIYAEDCDIDSCQQKPFLEFDDSTFSGHLAVNSVFGDYRTNGGDISFDHVGQTMMLGNETDAAIEQRINQQLERTRRFVWLGGTDTSAFVDEDGRCVIKFVRQSAPIEGEWIVTRACDQSTAPAARPVMLRFEAGRLSGCAGVNRIMGEYAIDGGRLSISNVGSTKMMGPHMEVEAAVLLALSKANSCVFSGGDKAVNIVDTTSGSTVLELTNAKARTELGLGVFGRWTVARAPLGYDPADSLFAPQMVFDNDNNITWEYSQQIAFSGRYELREAEGKAEIVLRLTPSTSQIKRVCDNFNVVQKSLLEVASLGFSSQGDSLALRDEKGQALVVLVRE